MVWALAVVRGQGEFTTYAGRSDLAAVLAVLAGLAFVAAGPVTSLVRPAGWIGDLALLAGALCGFAPFWAGWKGGPPLVLSPACLAAGFAFRSSSTSSLPTRPAGWAQAALAYSSSPSTWKPPSPRSAGRLPRSPSSTPTAGTTAPTTSSFARSLPRIARAIQDVDLWFVGAAASALGIVCIWRLAAASAPARRSLWPVLSAGITRRRNGRVPGRPLPNPAREPGGPSVSVHLHRHLRGGHRPRPRVSSGPSSAPESSGAPSRGSSPSSARRLLPARSSPPFGRAIGDPKLRIAYWLPTSRRYVDGRGRPVEEPVAAFGPRGHPARSRRPRVALVAHAAGVAELEREIGAAARLALENERLQAEVLTQLHDLRVSRTRIVETADAERRRLERDLHDGAQQRLLATIRPVRCAR